MQCRWGKRGWHSSRYLLPSLLAPKATWEPLVGRVLCYTHDFICSSLVLLRSLLLVGYKCYGWRDTEGNHSFCKPPGALKSVLWFCIVPCGSPIYSCLNRSVLVVYCQWIRLSLSYPLWFLPLMFASFTFRIPLNSKSWNRLLIKHHLWMPLKNARIVLERSSILFLLRWEWISNYKEVGKLKEPLCPV